MASVARAVLSGDHDPLVALQEFSHLRSQCYEYLNQRIPVIDALAEFDAIEDEWETEQDKPGVRERLSGRTIAACEGFVRALPPECEAT